MAKHIINSDKELNSLDKGLLSSGDIVVHKQITFAEIVGIFKKYFDGAELIPVSPGTECYTINGSNTSVIKSIGTPKIIIGE